MKQLERRVETLMGMLSATGAAPDMPETNSPTSAGAQSGGSDMPNTVTTHLPSDAPGVSPFGADLDAFMPCHPKEPVSLKEPTTYDPVHAGLLDETLTIQYFDEFRTEYTICFPFVVLDPSLDSSTMRREQPFLFLSIMATMAYRTPSTQRALGEAFKQQVATRIVGNSHKGLEMLQGLLVHAAYYHYYYQPGHQQLALMIQMCVAMAQELRLSRRFQNRASEAPPKLSNAGNRALLGTYYLAAAYVMLSIILGKGAMLTAPSFAQAWRKRTTVPYTKAIARACQSFSQQPEHASDLLIAPLVQASELTCRISEYFSYDDIEDSDIHGENVLKLSTSNFSAELRQLREAIPESVKNNSACTGALLLLPTDIENSYDMSELRYVGRHHSRMLGPWHAMAHSRSILQNNERAYRHASTYTVGLPDFRTYTVGCPHIFSQRLVLSRLVRLVLLDAFGVEDSPSPADW
jgi:hypothetical protein